MKRNLIRTLSFEEVNAIGGGQWGQLLTAAILGVGQSFEPLPCYCLDINRPSGEKVVATYSFSATQAIKKCYQACCINLRQNRVMVTGFMTYEFDFEMEKDEYISKC